MNVSQKKHIAVIGGGIYGITVALELSHHFQVTLFEEQSDLMQAASGLNQARIHNGYHYPRAKKTPEELRRNRQDFIDTYKEAVIKNEDYYYCIAKNGSRVSAEEYLAFCQFQKIPIKQVAVDLVDQRTVSLQVRVREERLDLDILREVCWRRLRKAGVTVKLQTQFTRKNIAQFDHTVICTYAKINALLDEKDRQQYIFQLCEKLVVKLPEEFQNTSIVIFDGAFVAIDPYNHTDYHLFGSVDYAIHHTNTGYFSTHPNFYNTYIHRGLITNPLVSHKDYFIASAKRFIPRIAELEYIGSFFVIKTLLPNLEESDDRPTVFRKVNERVSYVFAGKIANAVGVARDVLESFGVKYHMQK